ncbi:MAG: hypothetical protein CMJ48_00115 [Planctomycetaceae bacterium]|nr:hypothetical protein [Planctomycetaceae bacterium]
MNTPNVDLTQHELPCPCCGGLFPTSELKHASVPTISAMAAIGNSDPDDELPIDGMLDEKCYCTWCRATVNAHRAAAILLIVIVLPVLLFLVIRWLF